MWYCSVVCLINVSFFPKDISFLKDFKMDISPERNIKQTEGISGLPRNRWDYSHWDDPVRDVLELRRFIWANFNVSEDKKKPNNLQASVLLWWSWTPTNRMLFPSPQTVRVPVWTSRRPHFRLCETLPQALISIVYRRANRATFSSHHGFIAIPSIP